MHRRQRLAVHRPRQQDLGTARLLEPDRPTEALDGLGFRAHVGALEADVRRLAVGPASASTSASATPLQVAVPVARPPRRLARDARIAIRPARRLPAHCSVAVTSRSRKASRKVASERSSSRSTSPWTRRRHAPGSIPGRTMAAHVERVGRGQRAFGQRRRGGLGVVRLFAVDDQSGPLAIAIHATSVGSASRSARRRLRAQDGARVPRGMHGGRARFSVNQRPRRRHGVIV